MAKFTHTYPTDLKYTEWLLIVEFLLPTYFFNLIDFAHSPN